MKHLIAILTCSATLLATGMASGQQGAITSDTRDGPLTLSTFDYTAGAFCSLTWKGVQFIDARDHGRCLQSASSFDHLGENYNPTEAGASMFTDGLLPAPSSSQLMNYVIDKATLAAEVRMAFWNPVNGRKLSDHVHRKWVQAGLTGRPNVIAYALDFEIPPNEVFNVGQFEVLTGYMPVRFSKFYTLDPSTGAMNDLSDGPGEQNLPIIFATADGKHALGVWSPSGLTYGRWRFSDCVKWNAVKRVTNPRGTQRFRVFNVIGNVLEVRAGVQALAKSAPSAGNS